jgi:hypothetical protein
MAKLTINIGQSANDKNGDPLRTAFEKVNANFTELYSANSSAYALPTASTSVLGGVKIDGSTITLNGSSQLVATQYSLPTASTSVLGGIKVDGTSITINGSGVISAAQFNLGAGITTFLSSPTSANLLAEVSDETGTGSLLFATNPQVTTGIITDSTTFNLLDSVATTINFGRDATSIVIGNSSGNGVTNVQNNLAINGGLTRSSNFSGAAWGLSGIGLQMQAVTYTDTTSSGTVTNQATYVINTPTISATNATTYTNSYTLYVGGPPTSGTNVSQTTSWAAFFGGSISAAGITSTGTLALTGSTTSTISLGTSVTSATITIGGASGTGNINIAPSTTTQTVQLGYGATASTSTLAVNIGTGAAVSGGTKTISIGTGGLSGSITNISIGPTASGSLGTTTVNNILVQGISATVSAAGNAVQSERLGARYSIGAKLGGVHSIEASSTMMNARIVPSVAGKNAPNFEAGIDSTY